MSKVDGCIVLARYEVPHSTDLVVKWIVLDVNLTYDTVGENKDRYRTMAKKGWGWGV